MPVRLYEIKDEKNLARENFENVGIPVVQSDRRPSVSERIGTATVRARRRIREIPSYLGTAAKSQLKQQARQAPNTAQKVANFLGKLERANGGSGGQSMGMEDFIGGGRQPRRSGYRRSNRGRRHDRRAQKQDNFKWF